MSLIRAVFYLSLLMSPVATLAVDVDWQSALLKDHPLVGKIVEQKSGRVISYHELVTQLDSFSVILIGEKHDNPDHHRFESRLLHSLVDAKTAVAFEMLDDQQKNALQTLPADISLNALKTELQWPEKGWSWDDYGPLFFQVIQQGGHLKAANIDRSQMMTIYRDGLEALDDQRRFSSVDRVRDSLQAPIMDLVFDSHCGKMAKDKLQPMVDIQLAKDASMAAAVGVTHADMAPNRSILITGGVHARKDVGVPRHLPSNRSSVTLLMLEVNETLNSAAQYPAIQQNQADYVWFSPMFTDEDYCSRLSD
ncbi:ChaN family lipoprotein [Pseudomaricurvus sp.]|uniref:ChaN family lipoprotein n=1 Tax=Pseudomaricurvus sp. TaxID=2004510 RepID=UPI003F6D550C